MEEKVIAKETLKDSKLFCMMPPILGVLITVFYDFSVVDGGFAYAVGFGNGADYALYPMIIVLFVIGFIFHKQWSKVQIRSVYKELHADRETGC